MKKVFYLLLFSLVSVGVFAQSGQTADYTQGAFIVNEDWFGHQNSTVNFLTNEGEWIYRVFQKENPGRELGCTTQFGTIYGGKFYLVSKQQKDPGAKIKGSRFAVCDAKTMKVMKEFEFIATKTVTGKQGQDSLVSIADSRSYLPVDEHKGYIGTSNGIWLYDSDNMTIGKQIRGTGNPNDAGYGELYYAQIGTMLRVGDRVFAAHQQNGLIVIDAKTDTVEKTILRPEEYEEHGIGSIVLSKDGTIWVSVTLNLEGQGDALPYMYKINPYTLSIEKVDIPTSAGIEAIPNSWYAWTADGFCASTKENKIYWNGYGTGSWFTGFKIFCYDIDKEKFSLVYDITKMPGNWRLYGTGFRIHPVTDELYCFLYHNFNDPNYELARISSSGELLQEYPMIINYWFPTLPVFPDNENPVVSSKFPSAVKLTQSNPQYTLYLGDMVTDTDNMSAGVIKTVSEITPDSPFDAIVRNDSLLIGVGKSAAKDSRATITIQFNSNGKLITKEITVTSDDIETAAEKITLSAVSFYPNPATDYITVTGDGLSRAEIYSSGGAKVIDTPLTTSTSIDVRSLASGIYFVKITAAGDQVVRKMIRK